MSNEVAVRGGNTAVGFAGGNPFTKAGAGASVKQFAKFSGNTGNYTYGQDQDEIPHGAQLVADIFNSDWIWSFWWQGQVLASFNVKVVDDPLACEQYPQTLPDNYDGDLSLSEIKAKQNDRGNNFMDGWTVQGSFNLRELDNPNNEYTLKLNEGVALRSFRSLLESYGRQFQMKAGLSPVVELNSDRYRSKVPGVGLRFAPNIKIVGWVSEDDLAAGAGDNEEDYAEEEVVVQKKAAPVKDEEPAPAPAPARGRGRRNFG